MNRSTETPPGSAAALEDLGSSTIVLALIQALTNECACEPCQTLRQMAKDLTRSLAAARQRRAEAAPSDGHHETIPPPEAPEHPEAPERPLVETPGPGG